MKAGISQTARGRGKEPEARAGFTFIETLVALFILTISLAGAMALMTWMIRANGFSNQVTTAVTLAQDKLDELMDRRYSQIASGSDAVNTFQRAWTVTPSAARKNIAVTVRWSDSDGERHQVEANSLVDRKELGGY